MSRHMGISVDPLLGMCLQTYFPPYLATHAPDAGIRCIRQAVALSSMAPQHADRLLLSESITTLLAPSACMACTPIAAALWQAMRRWLGSAIGRPAEPQRQHALSSPLPGWPMLRPSPPAVPPAFGRSRNSGVWRALSRCTGCTMRATSNDRRFSG